MTTEWTTAEPLSDDDKAATMETMALAEQYFAEVFWAARSGGTVYFNPHLRSFGRSAMSGIIPPGCVPVDKNVDQSDFVSDDIEDEESFVLACIDAHGIETIEMIERLIG